MAKSDSNTAEPAKTRSHFIREKIEADVSAGKHGGRVVTRFPPEPNGYLHIGHATSINLNFGMAAAFPGGICNLRFDDTNPEAEDVEYVDAIQQDIRWLGFDWGDRCYFASDYFQPLFDFAVALIEKGLAFVDSSSLAEIRKMRGNFYEPGTESPYRARSIEENLDLFRRMRAGEFADGAHVLRAKIDMQSPDLNLRDPIMYRIRKIHHHRTGDEWPIYPMYDFAHGLSDAIECVTHSLCSLEFEDHRPLYDWYLQACETEARPEQIEFARLNLNYTVLSKRKLLQGVEERHVSGWDDPRMPTLCGIRRRGYPPEAILQFCDEVGVTKRDSVVDIGLLEHFVRDALNFGAPRAMGVIRPLKVVIENFPEDRVEELDAPFHPNDPSFGSRKLPLSRVVYVERDDFMEEPARKWFRLAPGSEVRLRYACLITCTDVIKDPASGEVVELRCSWDPDSLGGAPADGRKVRGTLHWVSVSHAVEAEVRLYDRLFRDENPSAGDGDFLASLNPDSLEVLTGCQVEPSLANAQIGDRMQLERLGYFCVDPNSEVAGKLVLNRTVGLRDTWAKEAKKTS
ncbi:MAG: glutamine--tRNA ligase/YqeY domain fusion protein [Deltaproteobacteria bacterium]|jgi:glutaminyl-tRNA synthetase|nr:glutamine--tRNA ligase/YqeY domain fusion protein [Deltaproteobacteria bacterium]